VRTYLERDLLQLSAVSSLPDFRRLMQAACLRVGQLLNQAELARDVALPQATAHRYLNLLEVSFLAYPCSRVRGEPDPSSDETAEAVLGRRGAGGCTSAGVPSLRGPSWRTWCSWTCWCGETGGRTVPRSCTGGPLRGGGGLRRRDPSGAAAGRGEGHPEAAAVARGRAARVPEGARPACRAGLLLHAGEELTWLVEDVLAAPWWMVC